MRNLLRTVCIALSIYYVCTKSLNTSKLSSVQQIIKELITLNSIVQDSLLMKSLYPDNKRENVPIEVKSCNAKHSIEALEGNMPDQLKSLHYHLKHFTGHVFKVNCTQLTHEIHEKEDIKTIIGHLLVEFQKYFTTLVSKQ